MINRKGRNHRSRFGVVYAVLTHLRESNDRKISAIYVNTNTSHDLAMEVISDLINLGLVEQGVDGRHKIWNLTSKGIEYLNQCNVLASFTPNDKGLILK